MKKTYLLGLYILISFSLPGLAQDYYPLLGETNEWNIVISVFEGVETYPYFANRDTIIDTLSYKILEEPFEFSNISLVHGYLREDTVNKIVYIRSDSSLTGIDKEFIYLDFSLEIGDTIELFNVNWRRIDTLNKFVVDSIKFINTNIGERKAIFLTGEHCHNSSIFFGLYYPDGYRNFNYLRCYPIWLEGVGSLSCPIYPYTEPIMNMVIPEYSDNALACYYKNGELIYQADFSLQHGCIISGHWGAVNENSYDLKIQIFPVPSNDIIEIKNKSIKNCELNLIDLTGKVILSLELFSFSNTELIITDLSNGLYFLQVKPENSSIFYKKIIKM